MPLNRISTLQAFEHSVDQNGHNHDHPFGSIVGSSGALKAVLETMKLVEPTPPEESVMVPEKELVVCA